MHANSSGVLHHYLLKDGLEYVKNVPTSPVNGHFIAAFMRERGNGQTENDNSDFHFYRLDADGNWSHKKGTRKVPEKLIGISPEDDAKKMGYKFVGFYKVPESGIRYYQNFYWDPDNIPHSEPT